MLYVEVRPWKIRQGRPKFYPLDQLAGLKGFRSVYAYPEDVRTRIEETRSTAMLDWAEVYSDTLLLDFDNAPTAAEECLFFFLDGGYNFQSWDSGGRSTHFHVRIEPLEGRDVPYSQRQWVAAHFPQADCSFYHHAGQFRLPGTVHEKTGNRKVLLVDHPGQTLEIPYLEKPAPKAGMQALEASDRFLAHLLRVKGEGERSQYCWHLAMQARREGLDCGSAIEHIRWWNGMFCHPPMDEREIERRVKGVYSR